MFVGFLYVVHAEILIGFLVREHLYRGEEATYRSTKAEGKKCCIHDS